MKRTSLNAASLSAVKSSNHSGRSGSPLETLFGQLPIFWKLNNDNKHTLDEKVLSALKIH